MVNGLSRLVKGPDSFRSKRVSWLGRIVQGSDFFDSMRNESDRQVQRQDLFRVNNCSCVMYGYSKVRIGSSHQGAMANMVIRVRLNLLQHV